VKHLGEMQTQRAELDQAIQELKDQIAWGESRLSEMQKESAA